ncbi:hypothetical protein [Streptomyces sp. NPDC003697]
MPEHASAGQHGSPAREEGRALTDRQRLQEVAAPVAKLWDGVVSGVRRAIAQAVVRLGRELGTVVTRAGLADAPGHALREPGAGIVPAAQGVDHR